MNTPIPNSQETLKNLYADKGEILTQLEIAQSKLGQINQQIANLLGLSVVQTPIQK